MAEKALYFDGTDDKVEATSAFGDIDFKGQAFTIEFWYKRASVGPVDYGLLVYLGATTDANFVVSVLDVKALDRLDVGFNRSDGGATDRVIVLAGSLSSYITWTDWNYFCITYDGSGTPDTDTCKIYVNNVERQSGSGPGTWGHIQANIIRLGECDAIWDLKGTIDEVHISNIVRDSTHRATYYNSGNGKEFEPDANSICLYHLDDETSPTDDASANSNDGTVTGASWVDGFPFLVEKTSSDSGDGTEAGASLNSIYSLSEAGTGTEALLTRLLASAETASGLDTGWLLFTSGDAGTGLDAILTLEAILTGADSGSGTDVSFLIKALLSTDSGLGTEAIAALLARIVAGELMVGSDRLVVKIESAPTGGGMSLPPGGKTSIPSRRVNL